MVPPGVIAETKTYDDRNLDQQTIDEAIAMRNSPPMLRWLQDILQELGAWGADEDAREDQELVLAVAIASLSISSKYLWAQDGHAARVIPFPSAGGSDGTL